MSALFILFQSPAADGTYFVILAAILAHFMVACILYVACTLQELDFIKMLLLFYLLLSSGRFFESTVAYVLLDVHSLISLSRMLSKLLSIFIAYVPGRII